MSKTKVVHLRMDGKNYFFGSVKALFDYIGEEKMGMSYRSFHSNVRLVEDETYVNRRRGYEVTVSHLLQATSNRGLQGSARAAHILRVQREAGLMPDISDYVAQHPETEMRAEQRAEERVLKRAAMKEEAEKKGPVQLDLFD